MELHKMKYDDSLYVYKEDNVFLRIDCSQDQLYELKEYFSCYIANYRNHPKVRARQWNGKVSFFDISTKTLPIGLLVLLKQFCKKFNYKMIMKFDMSKYRNEVSDDDLIPFYDVLFNGTGVFPRDYQHNAIKSAIHKKRGVLEACTGCHSRGTRVILTNGMYKCVEDIVVGDKIIGPSGTRTVMRTFSGTQKMYRVSPTRGQSFIINEDHILRLKFTGGSKSNKKYNNVSYINISVRDYLKENSKFKYETKLIYNNKPIIFDDIPQHTDLDAYFIGLYLGDGHTYGCAITTMDEEIRIYCENIAKKYNMDFVVGAKKGRAVTYKFNNIRGSRNPIFKMFEEIGLKFGNITDRTSCQEKFIPDIIKYGSVADRLDCIAGLIDSDGSLGKKSFDFCVSSKRLSDDMAFVCRSVGLYVYQSIKIVNNVEYYRCSISGDTSIIPTKLKRKQSIGMRLDRLDKEHCRGFSLEELPEDEYFGFELDGDHLYFLDDFCITHNSGKSIIIYSLNRFMMEDIDGKILIIVPSINLVNQLYNDYKEYGWNGLSRDVTLLFGKSKYYDPKKRITISTWQSIYKKPESFFKDFDAVVVDECHGAKSLSIKTVLEKCKNAEYKIGLTGTLPTEKVDLWNICGYLGPVIYKLRSEELINKGYLTRLRVVSLFLKYTQDEIKMNSARTYSEEVDFIINKENRNKAIDYIINGKHVDSKDNVLILAQRIDHIEKLTKYCEKRFPDRKVFSISGNTKPEEREQIRLDIEKYDGVILVATYGTLSTGVNIPKLHHVIFASFYKSKIKVLQSVGRGLRKHSSKNRLIVWDLVDDLRRRKKDGSYQENYAYKHYHERMSFYEEQKFKTIDKTLVLDE